MQGNEIQNNENLLIQSLKQGSEKAMGLCYDKYAASLYGIILKMVEEEQIAEEILQNAFVTIFKEIQEFEAKQDTLFTWMCKIAKKIAVNSIELDTEKRKQTIQKIIKEHPSPFLELIYFKNYSISELEKELKLSKDYIQKKLRLEIQQFNKKGGQHD